MKSLSLSLSLGVSLYCHAAPPADFGSGILLSAVSDDFGGAANTPPEDSKWFLLEPNVYFSANVTNGAYPNEFVAMNTLRRIDGSILGNPAVPDYYFWDVNLARQNGAGRLLLGTKTWNPSETLPPGVPPPQAPAAGVEGSEYQYASSQITSRAHVKHGYFELKGKLLNGAAVSAFWLYKNNIELISPDSWSPSIFLSTTEMDIFECHGSMGGGTYGAYAGNPPTTFLPGQSVFQSLHVGNSDPGSADIVLQRLFNAGVDYTATDVTFGFQWDEDKVTWYINGVPTPTGGTIVPTLPLYGENSIQTALNANAAPQYQDNTLRFPVTVRASSELLVSWMSSVNNGGLTGALPGITATPNHFEIDHIRVWQRTGAGTELVTDGNFDSGLGSWSSAVAGIAAATLTQEDGRAKIQIEESGANETDLRFSRNVSGLEAGKSYILNYHGWSSRGRDMKLRLVSLDGQTVYWSSKEFLPRDARLLSNSASVRAQALSSCSYVNLKMPLGSNFPGGPARLEFLFGGPNKVTAPLVQISNQSGVVVIDNVSLKETTGSTGGGSGSLVTNGSFSNGLTSWATSTHEGAAFSPAPGVDNGALSLNANPTGTATWHTQLTQEVTLPASGAYVLQFKAARGPGSAASRLIGVSISGTGGGGYHGGGELNIPATELSQPEAILTFPFSIPSGPAPTSLAFFTGGAAGTLLLDDIQITGPGGTNGGGGTGGSGGGSSVLLNGGFAADTNGAPTSWQTLAQAGNGTFSAATGELVLSGTDLGADNWNVQMLQSALPLVQPGAWTLKFRGRKTGTGSAVRPVFVDLSGEQSGNNFWYAGSNFDLTSTMEDYSMSVIVNAAQTATNGTVRFYLGGPYSGVVLDDVELLPPGSTGGSGSTNPIANPNFSVASGAPWYSAAPGGGAAATFTVVNGAGNVALGGTGTEDWHAQFCQTGIAMAANRTYTLRFKARADVARSLKILVSRDDGAGWYGTSDPISLTTDLTEKTYLFSTGSTGTSNGQIAFLLGTGPGSQTLTFDDIILE